jgi:hypothetical protein
MNWKYKIAMSTLLGLSVTASAASLSIDANLAGRLTRWIDFVLPNFPEPISVGLLGLGLIGIGICDVIAEEKTK